MATTIVIQSRFSANVDKFFHNAIAPDRLGRGRLRLSQTAVRETASVVPVTHSPSWPDTVCGPESRVLDARDIAVYDPIDLTYNCNL
jgi:hypothetical protein